MTKTRMPICLGCTRFRRDRLIPPACDAFPRGIPLAIVDNKADHRQPFPGDHGLRFEAKDDEARLYAERVFGPLVEVPALPTQRG